jgi:hypothetical protein
MSQFSCCNSYAYMRIRGNWARGSNIRSMCSTTEQHALARFIKRDLDKLVYRVQRFSI